MTEFELRCEEIRPRLRRYAVQLARNGTDAEDLVQITLAKAWLAYETYDQSRSFRNWVMAIMRRVFLDDVRAKGRRISAGSLEAHYREEGEAFEIDFVDPSPSLEERVVKDSFWRSVWDAVQELPAVYREVLVLIYLREMSYEQCAEAVGVPTGTVRSRLSRGRNHLRLRFPEGEPRSAEAPIRRV